MPLRPSTQPWTRHIQHLNFVFIDEPNDRRAIAFEGFFGNPQANDGNEGPAPLCNNPDVADCRIPRSPDGA